MNSVATCCRTYQYYAYGRVRDRYVGAVYCEFAFSPSGKWGWDVLEDMRRCGIGRIIMFDSEKNEYGWNWDLAEFRPCCIPSLWVSGVPTRWWFIFGDMYVEEDIGHFIIALFRLAVSEDFRIVKFDEYDADELMGFQKCRVGLKHVLTRRGSSLVGLEFPVVRRRGGYLRVGDWLAWHRVLGVLDYGRGPPLRWVLIGDDGLYLAEFTPTSRSPLEDYGEVGYVRVVAPYEGDTLDIASPCGAPRLVACSEEGMKVAEALLGYVSGLVNRWGFELRVGSWSCSRPFVIPGLVEVDVPNSAVLDWPLADPCPYVLKAADGDPLGLFTPGITTFESLFLYDRA